MFSVTIIIDYHYIQTPDGEHDMLFATPYTLQEKGYAIFHVSDVTSPTAVHHLAGSPY